MSSVITRRTLLRACAVAPIASLPLAAAAADLPLVTSADPTAAALMYVDDATKAKAAKPGSHCGGCALYQGAANSKSGPCSLFPGKQVKATGWCMAWAQKPK